MKNIKKIFNGLLPLVIDCEMSGVDPLKHAILEVAAYELLYTEQLELGDYYHQHVMPFPEAKFNEDAMQINGIVVDHPLRFAIDERKMMQTLSDFIQRRLRQSKCSRAILIGHNVHFDLAFLIEAQKRTDIILPIHHFCVLDTASLGLYLYQETVLAKIIRKAAIEFDPNQAHGALYDAQKTAELVCQMFNQGSFGKPKKS